MNNLTPQLKELIEVVFYGIFDLAVLFFIVGWIIKSNAPARHKTLLDGLISAINPLVFSIITAAVVALILYLLTLIISVISFSWIFVLAIFVISLIFWIYIVIKHGD